MMRFIYVAAFPNMAMSFLFQSNLQISNCTKESNTFLRSSVQKCLYRGLCVVRDAALLEVCSQVRLRSMTLHTIVGNDEEEGS